MKVCHFVLDSFNPLDILNESGNRDELSVFLKEELNEIFKGYNVGPYFERQHKILHPEKQYLCSDLAWGRIYSRNDVTEFLEETKNDPFSLSSYNSQRSWWCSWDCLPYKNFLWNKISELGIPNYWYTYQKLAKTYCGDYKELDGGKRSMGNHGNFKRWLSEDNSLSEVYSQVCSERANDNKTKVYKDSKDGMEKIDGTIHRFISMFAIEKNTTKELFNEIKDLWVEFYNGKESAMQMLYDILMNNINKNLKISCNDNKSLLKWFLVMMKNHTPNDIEFMHFANLDYDSFSHYLTLDDRANAFCKEHFTTLFKILRLFYNPDILFITCDHGSRLLNEYDMSNKNVAKMKTDNGMIPSTGTYKGKNIKKAMNSLFPYYKTHSTSQGVLVYVKEGIDINKIFTPAVKKILYNTETMVLSDNLYDLFSSEEFWNNCKGE